jgi:hypothetical protein
MAINGVTTLHRSMTPQISRRSNAAKDKCERGSVPADLPRDQSGGLTQWRFVSPSNSLTWFVDAGRPGGTPDASQTTLSLGLVSPPRSACLGSDTSAGRIQRY